MFYHGAPCPNRTGVKCLQGTRFTIKLREHCCIGFRFNPCAKSGIVSPFSLDPFKAYKQGILDDPYFKELIL